MLATASTSTLPGATLTGGAADCRWTVAAADAGVDVPWTLTLTDAIDVTVDTVQCAMVDESGLRFLEYVASDTEGRWCPRCDLGLCPIDKAVYTTTPGEWTSTFTWRPRPWDGPSDYGAEPGELWPPGAYRVVIEAEGTLAADGSAWELRLEAPLTLE